MKIIFFISWWLIGYLALKTDDTQCGYQKKSFHLTGHAQGTTWQITYFSDNGVVEKKQVDSILDVIDSSLSLYKAYSTIVAFNRSGTGLKIDDHFRAVVKASVDTYHQTHGLSDITVAPLVEAWGFGVKENNNIPGDDVLKAILPCVGTKNLVLRNDSLIKLKPCVKIDVNGIAQGYSVDVIADFLEKNSVFDYIIELGGELRIKGKKQPSGSAFRIGIESPAGDDFAMPPMQKILTLDSGAITSSGNYRKFHESKGKRVSHIINPMTGQSVNNELISVTVYAGNAITADAYDNALMLMGLDSAIRFVENRKDLGAFFIYRKQDGSIADTASSRFSQLISNTESTVKQN